VKEITLRPQLPTKVEVGMKSFYISTSLLLAGALLASGQEQTPDHRLRSAADVFREVMATPDKGIPHGLLDRAQCIVIIPGMKKAAFIVGADYGKGYAVCRTTAGTWGAPDPVGLSGGSFGPQLGVDSTDVILLMMTEKGLNHLMADKFTIGVDGAAVVGPVGRDAAAETDASLRAEILSWSRSHGLFVGASLDGTVLTHSKGETEKLYGREYNGKELIRGQVTPPPAAETLLSELNAYGPRK
jgi:lipid-binding SYLF domain-containing protein